MPGFGEFDQPIAFEAPVLTPDGLGGGTVSWVKQGNTAWAKVWDKGQAETERQGAQRASRLYFFKVHARNDVLESWRINWAGTYFNIREIARGTPRNLTMLIVAEAGVTQ